MASAHSSSAPTVAGRWSLLPHPDAAPTARATALAEQLLERYGVVTRGAVQAEGVEGGFALAYKVLSSLEETGRVRRGYFVEGLGAAQFATPATVDRLRAFHGDRAEGAPPVAITLGATDPANPYGASLGWPEREGAGLDARPVSPGAPQPAESVARRSGHRPGRKAGALVVLVDGELGLFVEKGGKTVLSFIDADAEAAIEAAAASLVGTIRAAGGRLRVERIDGVFAVGTPLGDALVRAGFVTTPQGLRLR